jgi:DNA-binding NtrC family response regulator
VVELGVAGIFRRPYASMARMGGSVLVVDDDELIAEMLVDVLTARGDTVHVAKTVEGARRAMNAADHDAIILDMHLPDGLGIDVLRLALDRAPAPQVLVITARAEIRGAVEAMRLGAADYLEKPLDVTDLTTRLDRALEAAQAKRKLSLYEEMDRKQTSAVVESGPLKEVFGLAGRLAATPASSGLILGESGVGKEVLAAHIHATSDRRNAPFVRVNLAAIPESMIEAELFGSVRGAFTDAKRDRAGHFASAEGGTLLLDELCEFKPELQPKLLRVLEERRYFPVGSDRERKMNVRVLAATNRDPQAAIADGRLRPDLYYRLATVILRIPPLRERREDIAPMADHFLARFRTEFSRPRVQFAPAAREALIAHDWPGNVRELRNVVERATMLATGDVIAAEDLDIPLPVRATGPAPKLTALNGGSEPMRLEEAERAHIARILEAQGGSRTRAATVLGISRSTLWEKLKRYGMA